MQSPIGRSSGRKSLMVGGVGSSGTVAGRTSAAVGASATGWWADTGGAGVESTRASETVKTRRSTSTVYHRGLEHRRRPP